MIHTKMMRTSCFSKHIPKIHLPPSQPTPSYFENQANITSPKQKSPDAPKTRRIQGAYRGGVVRTRMWAQAWDRADRSRGAQKVTTLEGFHSKGPWDIPENSNKWGCWRPSWVARGPKLAERSFWGEIIPVRFFWRILIRPLSKKAQLFFLSTC